MRILHVGKYFAPVPGGMERFLEDLAAAQRRAGHDVQVLVHAEPGQAASGDPSWLLRCPTWFRLVFAPISPAFPFWLQRILRDFRPDVVHLHLPNPSAFWLLLLPTARALPCVVHWHSDVEPSRFRWSLRLLYPHFRILERALLERADLIIATSPQYLDGSVPLREWRHKCRVVPLGVAPERLPEVVEADADDLWPGGGLRLLSIGRLTYYKGFETLLRAVTGMPGVQLVIVGEGEDRPVLERLLTDAGNPPSIQLPGRLDDRTCQRLLASCDIFCLPSRERTEAFGIVLMEAMRYGRPVLASRLPASGVSWLVREGENGYLVAVDDVNAWREALTALAADRDARIRLGAAGYLRYQFDLDITDVAGDIEGLYGRIVAEGSGAPARTQEQGPLIVIPAYNEAASIGQVVGELFARGFADVLVVDDGSDDGTADIAAASGAHVLRPPLHLGAWGAMQTGIRYAVAQGYSGVVTMDADGQHEPEYLPALLARAADADVVIGACPQRGSRMRHLAWAWFRRLTGFSYADLTSGFRYYSRRSCLLLAGEEATLLDYQDIGVLLLLHRAGHRVAEVPVAMNVRQHGPSRIFSSWWVVLRYMLETTLLCAARWRVS
jgi:glycosyltransferase involved in cell wall biosynthesis